MAFVSFFAASGAFFSDADESWSEYLSGSAGDQTTFLVTTKGVTFYDHRPETVPNTESFSKWPCVLIWTSGTVNSMTETNSHHIECTTTFRIFTNNSSTVTAGADAQAIGGAIVGALSKGGYNGWGGTDLASYVNFAPITVTLGDFEVNPETDNTPWVAQQVVEATWTHWELQA